LASKKNRSKILVGIIFILLGLYFLLINLGLWQGLAGNLFLVVLGVAFICAFYISGKAVGFLIPGLIMTLVGMVLALLQSGLIEENKFWPLIITAVGVAFVLVYFLATREKEAWPLVMGIVLLVASGMLLATTFGVLDWDFWHLVGYFWPVVLIFLGIWILLRPLKS
jgi:hypothetical protein